MNPLVSVALYPATGSRGRRLLLFVLVFHVLKPVDEVVGRLVGLKGDLPVVLVLLDRDTLTVGLVLVDLLIFLFGLVVGSKTHTVCYTGTS